MVRWAYPSYTAFMVNGRGSNAVHATSVISSNNKTLRAVLNDMIKGSINDMRVEIFDQVSGFAVGSVVYVERRMGPNENKPGGMARFFCVYFDYLACSIATDKVLLRSQDHCNAVEQRQNTLDLRCQLHP